MQFDRGYMSPYFITDTERNQVAYDGARLLLVDKKISSARDMVNVLELSIQEGFPLIIMAEDIEQEALATLVVNRLRGSLKVFQGRSRDWFSGFIWDGLQAFGIQGEHGLYDAALRKPVLNEANFCEMDYALLFPVVNAFFIQAAQPRKFQAHQFVDLL